MDLQPLIRSLHKKSDTKIVLVVADGLGGLPIEPQGLTELESARTPHLDQLASQGVSGLVHPVLPGITCGSGPGHLALFGYDPLQYPVGRGVLSALGIDFALQPSDVAARGNFCTVDKEGRVTDRRAGRIDDGQGRQLVELLQQIQLEGVELFVEHVKQYRFAVIFRGPNLSGKIRDTDPRATGVEPHRPVATDHESQGTALVVEQFLTKAAELLNDKCPANMVLLRGFASLPDLPLLQDAYGLDGCAIAIYPMYRGLARLVGMHVPEITRDLPAQVGQLESEWERHNFFFVHYKDTDSSGEDGDFDRKVRCIEELDAQMPRIVGCRPDVLIVTGDHSTPCLMRSHSWHPVPLLLAAGTCRPDQATRFGERQAAGGGLGHLEAKYVMPLALAHAGRLDKYGA